MLGDHARTPHLQRKRNRARRTKYRWVEVDDGGGKADPMETRELDLQLDVGNTG